MERGQDIHWDFEKEKIQFVDENGDLFMPVYAYDPPSCPDPAIPVM